MKKPSSIRSHAKVLSSSGLSLSKDKTGFFITSRFPRVLSEKINYIKATKFFLCGPLPRVLSASGVIMRFKKDYPCSGCLEKHTDPHVFIAWFFHFVDAKV